MSRHVQTQVLIVGAGPVGLTLAMDLAQRGISVCLAEVRSAGEPPSVKCNHVSARSMEVFRRLGVANALRQTGLPADYPNDVAYRTRFTGTEIARIPIPCRQDRYSAKEGPDTWWPTPEPPHRINQIFLEPVLFAHAASQANIRIFNRVQVQSCAQSDSGVVCQAVNLDTQEPMVFDSAFVVGCDGARSLARKWIGAKLSGTDVVSRVQSTYFRAPDLIHRQGFARAWATFSINPQRSGNVYAIDGQETWLLHNYLRDDEPDFESVDRDWALRQILGVGDDFQYEILSKEDWFGRRLVADTFRDRRIFICGDAAHLWVPMAGYGMNAGIADAMNLSWQLAAHLRGWAGAAILDAYQAERQPITEQVSRFAMNHEYALAKERRGVAPEIEQDDEAGQRARTETGRALYDLNVKQYCCAGLNFGYYYDQSHIIAYDDEHAPAYGMDQFTPTTVPGCRAPHFWLPNGQSFYDVLGPEFTLLRLDRSVSVAPLQTAAAQQQMPLHLLDLDPTWVDPSYRHKLLIVRPDQHVAWRGNALPHDAARLLRQLTGHASV